MTIPPTITAGDHRTLALFVPVAGSTTTPRNLTGCRLDFRAQGETLTISKSSESGEGITIPDPATGIAYVSILPEDTAALPGPNGERLAVEVQLTTADNRIETVISLGRGVAIAIEPQLIASPAP